VDEKPSEEALWTFFFIETSSILIVCDCNFKVSWSVQLTKALILREFGHFTLVLISFSLLVFSVIDNVKIFYACICSFYLVNVG